MRNTKELRKLSETAQIGMLGNYCETRYKDFNKELDDPKNRAEEKKRMQTTYQGYFRNVERGTRASNDAPQLFPHNPHFTRMQTNLRIGGQ